MQRSLFDSPLVYELPPPLRWGAWVYIRDMRQSGRVVLGVSWYDGGLRPYRPPGSVSVRYWRKGLGLTEVQVAIGKVEVIDL